MMELTKILQNVDVLASAGSMDKTISSLHFDSREVEAGSMFFAHRGTQSDGHDFIDTAIVKGAVAVVCEHFPDNLAPGITFIKVEHSNYALGLAASCFFKHPSRKLKLIGVTGTNGKTTTVTLLFRLFRELGYSTGLLSTIQNQINDQTVPSTHTTPDPIQINRLLQQMVDDHGEYCFMEVSSHAVDQHRIAGLTFAGGLFTNITHDHLDYHKTLGAYLNAKKVFFDTLPADAFALVNKDDKNGMVMLQNTMARKFTYSCHAAADFRCRIMENQLQGLQLNIDGSQIWFRLIGNFNAYNLLAVYAVALLLGQEKDMVLTILSRFGAVEGRFNQIRSGNGITAIVDYAHTPDALKNVLETINAIREHHEQLITVIGAGGNRDISKRPLMAGIACELSDKVILTSDNPRFEDPEAILKDMQDGVERHQAKKVLVIENRKEAIKTACSLAKSGDIILVAGKGHENYQEIKGVKHHFDDKEVLNQVLSQ